MEYNWPTSIDGQRPGNSANAQRFFAADDLSGIISAVPNSLFYNQLTSRRKNSSYKEMISMRMLNATIAASTVLGFVLCSSAIGQEPNDGVEQRDPTVTSEQWYYQQMLDRYDSPRAAVRRRAEFRGQQRQARLAAMKWYGFSNSRPVASATPFTAHVYSPAWQGSWGRPYAWHTTGRPTVVVRPEYHVYR